MKKYIWITRVLQYTGVRIPMCITCRSAYGAQNTKRYYGPYLCLLCWAEPATVLHKREEIPIGVRE